MNKTKYIMSVLILISGVIMLLGAVLFTFMAFVVSGILGGLYIQEILFLLSIYAVGGFFFYVGKKGVREYQAQEKIMGQGVLNK